MGKSNFEKQDSAPQHPSQITLSHAALLVERSMAKEIRQAAPKKNTE